MAPALRALGYGVVGLIALWALLQALAIVFGIVSWIVSTVITLAVLAALVYVGYLIVSTVLL